MQFGGCYNGTTSRHGRQMHCTPDLLPLVDHDLPEDDGVLHEGEEHKEHAGQEPHLQRRHCVAHGDPRPKTNLEKTFLL